MKFIHLGDLHIGKSLGEFDLLEDQQFILDQIIQLALDRQIDAILIAGDIYDKPIPSEAAVRVLDQFLRKLAENSIKAFLISGNHDSDERLNFGSSFFEANGIYIAAKQEEKIYKRTIEDAYGTVNLYLLPFVKASQVRRYLPEETIENYEDAIRVLLSKEEIDTAQRNIILSHQFVTGESEDPALSGSEGLAVVNVGTIEKVGSFVYDPFDYAALGHIHSAQHVGREEVRYSGSPLKYSLSEAGHKKSVPVVELKEKGNLEISFESLIPKRDLRHIKGPMEMLLKEENITAPDDFIYVTLMDEEVIPDAMGIFQQVYPNTIRIDYDNSRTKEVEQIDIAEITEGRSFTEMISDFYRKMYGCEINEEELELMEKIAGKAGVVDETD